MTLKYFSGNRIDGFFPCRKQNMPQKYFLARESPLSFKKTPRNFKPLHFFSASTDTLFPLFFSIFSSTHHGFPPPFFRRMPPPPLSQISGSEGDTPHIQDADLFCTKKIWRGGESLFFPYVRPTFPEDRCKKSVERQTRNGTAG